MLHEKDLLKFLCGGISLFIVAPHWLFTNIRWPLCFSSSLLLSEETPSVPGRELNPGPTIWQAGVLAIERRLTPN